MPVHRALIAETGSKRPGRSSQQRSVRSPHNADIGCAVHFCTSALKQCERSHGSALLAQDARVVAMRDLAPLGGNDCGRSAADDDQGADSARPNADDITNNGWRGLGTLNADDITNDGWRRLGTLNDITDDGWRRLRTPDDPRMPASSDPPVNCAQRFLDLLDRPLLLSLRLLELLKFRELGLLEIGEVRPVAAR
jgi:hypothetical protein